MSTSDGYVVGLHKIVDHGPNSQRYNIVKWVSPSHPLDCGPRWTAANDRFVRRRADGNCLLGQPVEEEPPCL